MLVSVIRGGREVITVGKVAQVSTGLLGQDREGLGARAQPEGIFHICPRAESQLRIFVLQIPQRLLQTSENSFRNCLIMVKNKRNSRNLGIWGFKHSTSIFKTYLLGGNLP